MKQRKPEYIQCAKCGIPKYRHPYFEDCGHDFLNEEYLKQNETTKNEKTN